MSVIIAQTSPANLNGSNSDDFIQGSAGNDTINGHAGNDTINGQNEDDILQGSSGFDIINGGQGDDTIYGGANADVLTGGKQEDTFRIGFAPRESIPTNAIDNLGVDTITDFNLDQDIIELDADVFAELADTLRADFSNAKSLAAADQNAVLIYDRSSGLVYYNEDAATTGDEKAILQLDPGKKGLEEEHFGTF
jgi:Ca2+-binding RTX toxin-like protein